MMGMQLIKIKILSQKLIIEYIPNKNRAAERERRQVLVTSISFGVAALAHLWLRDYRQAQNETAMRPPTANETPCHRGEGSTRTCTGNRDVAGPSRDIKYEGEYYFDKELNWQTNLKRYIDSIKKMYNRHFILSDEIDCLT